MNRLDRLPLPLCSSMHPPPKPSLSLLIAPVTVASIGALRSKWGRRPQQLKCTLIAFSHKQRPLCAPSVCLSVCVRVCVLAPCMWCEMHFTVSFSLWNKGRSRSQHLYTKICGAGDSHLCFCSVMYSTLHLSLAQPWFQSLAHQWEAVWWGFTQRCNLLRVSVVLICSGRGTAPSSAPSDVELTPSKGWMLKAQRFSFCCSLAKPVCRYQED